MVVTKMLFHRPSRLNLINKTKKLGLDIPRIGFGTWKLTPKEAEESVFLALQTGYRLIDTASIYGNEDGVGKGIKKALKKIDGLKREDIFVVTKLWNANHGNPREALEKSLKKLGLNYIDLYLIHWPVKESLSTWKEFKIFKEEGLVRNIGVSNFTIAHLEKILPMGDVYANQVEFSPFLFQEELMDYCNSKEIKIMSYSPLMQGGTLLEDPTIKEIALKRNRTPAQIVLRWHVQLGLVPIPKSKHPERIKENFNIFEFKLNDIEMKKISSLSTGKRFCWNPEDAKWAFFEGFTKLIKTK
jgi:diketogulonate reductase-like aldo/keto reductase